MSKVAEIVNEIIEKVQKNKRLPWQKPWIAGMNAPSNLISGKPYRGVNRFILGGEGRFFLTEKQAKERGASLKAGEKPYSIVFYARAEKKDAMGEDNSYGFFRVYQIYSSDSFENLNHKRLVEKPSFSTVPKNYLTECYVKNEGINLSIKDCDRAFYRYGEDLIRIPKPNQFKSVDYWFATLSHECGHSTGRHDRLNRKELVEYTGFGSCNYSREELVAEMTAAMLSSELGFKLDIDNTTAYLQSWIKALQDDTKMLFWAAAKAEQSFNYIMKYKSEYSEVLQFIQNIGKM